MANPVSPLRALTVRKVAFVSRTNLTSLVIKRHHQTAAKRAENVREKQEIKTSKSFCFNAFQGEFCSEQVFPYPDVLTGQQKNQLSQMVDRFTALGEQGIHARLVNVYSKFALPSDVNSERAWCKRTEFPSHERWR